MAPTTAILADAIEQQTRRAFEVSGPHLTVGLVSALVTTLCILVHYEAMSLGVRWMPRTGIPPRARIVGLILTMLIAHVIEIWIFGLAYWYLEAWPHLGEIHGSFDEGALDYVYFSVVTFATLGYGDFVPTGPITILCGTEALVGLNFLAWTASIAFLEIQRDWAEVRRTEPHDRAGDQTVDDANAAVEPSRREGDPG